MWPNPSGNQPWNPIIALPSSMYQTAYNQSGILVPTEYAATATQIMPFPHFYGPIPQLDRPFVKLTMSQKWQPPEFLPLENIDLDQNAAGSNVHCTWCKLPFGGLTKIAIRSYRGEKAEICLLCQTRTGITRKSISYFISGSRNAQDILKLYDVGEFASSDELIGFLNDVIACKLCQKSLPKRDMLIHLTGSHEFNAFRQCDQNCAEILREEDVQFHSAICQVMCSKCVRPQKGFVTHALLAHKEIAIVDMNNTPISFESFTNIKVLLDHFVRGYIWK